MKRWGYPYSITEIFENNEFNTKEILTQSMLNLTMSENNL